MQGYAAGHPREHDSRRRDDGARRGRARRRARLPSVDARRRRPGAPRRQAAGALRGGAPAEGRMVRQPPLARTVRGWRAARDRRRAHGAQTGGRRGPDRRGGECARSARPRVRRAHAAGRSHGASRRARPPRQPPLARPLGGPARPRDADVWDVLPGDDVRSRAAPDPGRRARGQPDDRRARTRRPALARHELSLSALSGERRAGGARMTDEVMARAVGGPDAGLAGAAGTGGGSAGNRRGPLLYSDVIRERWRRPRFRGELPGASAVAEDVNPLCGDRVRLMVALEGDRVATARFVGDSCAICTASADVLAELVVGRSRAEALRVDTADVLAVLQADIRPTRMRCVTLPLSVFAMALNGKS